MMPSRLNNYFLLSTAQVFRAPTLVLWGRRVQRATKGFFLYTDGPYMNTQLKKGGNHFLFIINVVTSSGSSFLPIKSNSFNKYSTLP
jgi:hypothetical protein